MKKSGNKFIYGVGNLGYSVISQTLTSFFMFFGTSVLKVSGLLVGIAIAIATFWDGITDPFVGYISDKYTIKGFGHRSGYMFIATFGMTILNIFIWFVPLNISIVGKFLWILIGLIGIETFNTMYSTPYMALGSDISNEYHDRTLIQVYKTIFFLLGMIIPSIMLFLFLPDTVEYPIGQLNPFGYHKMAIVSSVVCLICGLICVFGTRKKDVAISKNKISGINKNKKISGKQMFRNFLSSLKDKQQRCVIFGYSISLLSGVILTSVGMHFFTYCFNFSAMQITILLSSLLVGTIVSQPLWFYISKKHDKLPALLTAIFVSVIGVFCIITLYLLRQELGNTTAFILILISIFVCGFGSGALYSLPTSMYNDIITIRNTKNQEGKTATYTGMLTFSCNVANSMALLIIGGLLDIIKFDGHFNVQSLSVQTGLALILFVGVQASLIISFYIFSQYKVKEKDIL